MYRRTVLSLRVVLTERNDSLLRASVRSSGTDFVCDEESCGSLVARSDGVED